MMSQDKLTVAVVGNAPFARQYGGLIDECDVVIRFNEFKIKGYEALVGSKTTIWCSCSLGPRHRKKCREGLAPCKTLWISRWRNKRNKDAIYSQAIKYGMIPYFVPASQLKEVTDAISGKVPSTGLVGLYAALQLFPPPLLTFGFNHFNPRRRHHYYEKKKHRRMVHTGQAERRYFKRLQAANMIINFK